MIVCLVGDNNDIRAGWGRLLTEVGQALEKEGHQVMYCIRSGTPDENTSVIPMHVLSPFRPVRFLRSACRLRSAFRKADIIHVFDVNPYGVLTTLAATGLNKPIILNALGTYSLFHTRSRLRNAIFRWVYRKATQIVVVSNFVRRQIEKSGFRLKNPLTIPVGVDCTRFAKTAESSPGEETPESRYILGVGGIKNRKGFHLSIDAFARLAPRFPDLLYVIVGSHNEEDPYYSSIRKSAEAQGVLDRIVWKQGLDDQELIRLYRGAELFVLAPITTPDALEGFGMVYLEANAAGTPVVGTLDSGAEAAIQNGYNGLLVAADPTAIAQAMESILADPTLQEQFSVNASQWVRQFDWECIGHRYLDLYTTLKASP